MIRSEPIDPSEDPESGPAAKPGSKLAVRSAGRDTTDLAIPGHSSAFGRAIVVPKLVADAGFKTLHADPNPARLFVTESRGTRDEDGKANGPTTGA